jgi:Zeta toxin
MAVSLLTKGTLVVIYLPDRNKDQGRIVAAFYYHAADFPCERKAIMAGGLRGADKDNALASSGIDRSQYLLISVDAVLEELAQRSLIPVLAGLSAMDCADLVHGEAQFVAKREAARTLADGRNLLLDITMASEPSVRSWLQVLDLAGYSLEVVFAQIGDDDAVRWADAEHQRGHEEYRRGIGNGGRYVSSGAIRAAGPAVRALAENDWFAITAQLNRQRMVQFPGGEVFSMIRAYQDGELPLSDLSQQLRNWNWQTVPPVCPPGLEKAEPAVDDLEPWIPGSFDEVVLGYDLGLLSEEEYAILARPAS